MSWKWLPESRFHPGWALGKHAIADSLSLKRHNAREHDPIQSHLSAKRGVQLGLMEALVPLGESFCGLSSSSSWPVSGLCSDVTELWCGVDCQKLSSPIASLVLGRLRVLVRREKGGRKPRICLKTEIGLGAFGSYEKLV